MKLLGWNINALAPTVRNSVLKYGSFKGLFEEYGADIVCLQETKVRDDKLTEELCCVEGYQSFWAISRERKGYSGVATYASDAYAPLSCEADCLGSGEGDLDREGRIVITDHAAFVLVNVYVPNAGDRPDRPRLEYKIRFLQALKDKCDALAAQGRELIITGDFNVAASPQDVHPTMKYDEMYSPEERGAMLALLGSYTDVWRRLHPGVADVYTVWDEYTGARAFNRGLRIDYFLLTPGLLDKVVACEMVPTPPKWSDHTGMVLELRDIPPVPAHPPCAQWTKLRRRFRDDTQPSIAALFVRKKAGQGCAPGAGPPASKTQKPPEQQQATATGSGGGGSAAGAAAPAAAELTSSEAQRQQQAGQEATSVSGQAGAVPLERHAAAGPAQQREQRQQQQHPGEEPPPQQQQCGGGEAAAGEGGSDAPARGAAGGSGGSAGGPAPGGSQPQGASTSGTREANGGQKRKGVGGASDAGQRGGKKRKSGDKGDGGQRSIAAFFKRPAKE